MSNQPLSKYRLTSGDYGWSGQFPGGPHRLFGKDVSLEIHTRLTPTNPQTLPPVSHSQAALVLKITSELAEILRHVESELEAFNQKFDSDFASIIRTPHVWLDCESDDGESWTFVVGRTDNPDFGYDLEFRGTKFFQLCAGD